MASIPVPVPPVVADRTRRVLCACQHARSAADYAARLVDALASETRSEYAIWLDAPAAGGAVIAQTANCGTVRERLRALSECAPVLSNDLSPEDGIRSVAVAPVLFRRCITGVLVIANAKELYTSADLVVLTEAGRAAITDYERLERAVALGLGSPQQLISDFVHALRQPLGILEACAYYLDLVLPAEQIKAHNQVAEMQVQLDIAAKILEDGCASYGRGAASRREAAEEPARRVLTNSAMSMVT